LRQSLYRGVEEIGVKCNQEVTACFISSVTNRSPAECSLRGPKIRKSPCPILPTGLASRNGTTAARLWITLPKVLIPRPVISVPLDPLLSTWSKSKLQQTPTLSKVTLDTDFFHAKIPRFVPRCNKCLNVSSDYVKVWCVTSATHAQCTPRSKKTIREITMLPHLFEAPFGTLVSTKIHRPEIF